MQVAYFPNWSIYQKGYKPEHVPVQHLTHILYAFANIKDSGEVVLSDEWADRQIKYDGDGRWVSFVNANDRATLIFFTVIVEDMQRETRFSCDPQVGNDPQISPQ